MYDENFVGLEGFNYPENGKLLFQEDFILDQELSGKEVIDRETDFFSGGIISGGEVTVSAALGCVDISGIVARDGAGRRIKRGQTNSFSVPVDQTVKIIVRHKWVNTEYINDGSGGQVSTKRTHFSEILYIGDSEPLTDRDVPLRRVSRAGNTVTLLDDLRSRPVVTLGATAHVTGKSYLTGDRIWKGFTEYRCVVTHVAGDWITDWIINGYWMPVGNPPGTMRWSAAIAPEFGEYKCDGAIKSRTNDADIWARLSLVIGDCIITAANPCVVTKTSHGRKTGDIIIYNSISTVQGLVINTNYYVIRVDDNNFNLASSWANCLAGTKIATTGSAGTGNITYAPFGVPSGDASNFYLPDARGGALRAVGTSTKFIDNTAVIGLGNIIDDAVQDFWREVFDPANAGSIKYDNNAGGGGEENVITAPTNDNNRFKAKNAITDGVHGAPRVGSTTLSGGFETTGKATGSNCFIKR